MLKKICVLLIFLLLSFHGRAENLGAIKNIPLAPGLTEIKENGQVMEGPLGPIQIAYAKGMGPADKVREFYETALPKLGWEKQAMGKWRLGKTTLTLDFTGSGRDPVVVAFALHGEIE